MEDGLFSDIDDITVDYEEDGVQEAREPGRAALPMGMEPSS